MNSLISPAVNEGTRRLSPTMMMVSVRSVRVTDIDRENTGDLYGTIRIGDSSTVGRQVLDVRRANARKHAPGYPDVAFDSGGLALLDGGVLELELWDRDRDASPDDLIAKRTVVLPPDLPDGDHTFSTRRGESHDISGVGTKETYGAVDVVYTVQRYWTNIELPDVVIWSIDGEKVGDLYGTIRTSHADRSSAWSSHNFLLRRWETHGISAGESVPLASLDPPGFDLASVTFDLWDADGWGSADDKIAQGTLVVDKHEPIDAPRLRIVGGQYGMVFAWTTWNARTNRTPVSPLGPAAVVTGDGS